MGPLHCSLPLTERHTQSSPVSLAPTAALFPSPPALLRFPPATPCSATKAASSPVSSHLPPPLPSPHSIASSPRPPFPQTLASPSNSTSSTPVDSPDPQALKASAKLSHLKSPSKPDAVLAFLAGLGVSGADVAAIVAKDPLFLCTGVERTLNHNVAGLTALGLSHTDIARLVSKFPLSFRRRSSVSKMHYYLPIFGSFDSFLRALYRGPYLLSCHLDNAVKPNVASLLECGLDVCGIGKLCVAVPRMFTANPKDVQAVVARAECLGVPRDFRMFRHALQAVAFLSEEKIAAKVEYLKNTFRWSDPEVRIAVSKLPTLLTRSKQTLRSRSEFLISEVGLEPAFIVHRTALFTCSLEGRLRPRYYVLKFLMENGLVKRDPSYYTVVTITEKAFMEKFICPLKEAAPHLAEDYATACRGQVPINFRLI